MSAQSAIKNLLEQLQTTAASYRSEAQSLIDNADQMLLALKRPTVSAVQYHATRGTPPDFVRVPNVPELPGIDALTLPEMEALQPVNDLPDQFTAKIPTLHLPTFPDLTLPEAPVFTAPVPSAQSLAIDPVAPVISDPMVPTLTAPTAVSADPISLELPVSALPTFTAFSGDFTSAYQAGVALASEAMAGWRTWLASLRAEWEPLDTAFLQTVSQAVVGNAPALDTDWEAQRFRANQLAALRERFSALDSVDALPTLPTELPTGTRRYALLGVEARTSQSLAQATTQTINAWQDLEVQHRQWAFGVALKTAEAVLPLRGEIVGYRTKGLLLALEAASGALDVALKVLEFKRREIALLVRYNALQERRLRAALRAELSKLESIKIAAENNRLTVGHNQQQAQLYQAALDLVGVRVQNYQTQLEMIGIDGDWRDLDFSRYESQVAVYQAQVREYLAEQSGQRAQLKGQVAEANGEFAKVRLHQAELRGQTANVRAKVEAMKAKTAENQNKLAAYNAVMAAQLESLRLLDQNNRTALSAIVKSFDAEVSTQELAISVQQLQDQADLHQAANDLRVEQLTLLKTLQEYAVQLAQATAQSTVINSGATTMGHIAAAAFSGLNAIGVQQLTEEG